MIKKGKKELYINNINNNVKIINEINYNKSIYIKKTINAFKVPTITIKFLISLK